MAPPTSGGHLKATLRHGSRILRMLARVLRPGSGYGQPLTRRVSARMRFEPSALVNGSWSCDDMCSPPTLTRSGFDWIEGADLEQWFSKEEE